MRRAMIVAACLSCAAGEATAEVVFTTGSNFTDSGGGPGVTRLQFAEHFELAEANIVNGASIPIVSLVRSDRGLPNLGSWDGTLQWEIYKADPPVYPNLTSVTPSLGVLVASGNGENIITTFRHQTPRTGGAIWEYYMFDFDFGQDVPIMAGTQYWVALHLNQSYAQDKYLYWEGSADDAIGYPWAAGRWNGTGGWTNQSTGFLAFALVPAPSSLGLLLTLGSAAALRRRRSSHV